MVNLASVYKFKIITKMRKVKLKQIKSIIGASQRQKNTIKALGLGKINKQVEHEATPQVIGMVNKVNHLITVDYQ
jgi:large subunit ribosomal protein L30